MPLAAFRILPDDASHLPLRTEPERPSPPRPCLLGVAQPRPRARAKRALSATHRGHRCDALPARIRGRDRRGSGLAWAVLGEAGVAAIRAFRGIPGGGR